MNTCLNCRFTFCFFTSQFFVSVSWNISKPVRHLKEKTTSPPATAKHPDCFAKIVFMSDLFNSGESEKVSFSQAHNGRGRWAQLLESFWATRLLPSTVIYREHALILWQICHNIKLVRFFPPVVGAFPCPLGHPVKHRETHCVSYSGSQRLRLLPRRRWNDLEMKIIKLEKLEPRLLQLSE